MKFPAFMSPSGESASTGDFLMVISNIARHVLVRLSSFSWRHSFHPGVLFGWDDLNPRSSSTSWLDGLRGVAALQVFFFHFFGRHTQWGHTYGSSEEDVYLHQLPIIRSVWGAGSGAVSTFFVISGYAITVRSFRLLRQKNYEDLYSGLCSSLIRRGFRLYLPVLLLAIPTMFLIRFVDLSDGFLYQSEVLPTMGLQFEHFMNVTDDIMNPFVYMDQWLVLPRYAYVPTAWTIPMEYYGSMVCYILVMVTSRVPNFRLRFSILFFFAFYALHRGSWWVSNFLVGTLLADATTEQQTNESQSSKFADTTKSARYMSRLRTAFFAFVALTGVYLAGMPPQTILYDFHPVLKPGYEFLYKYYPPFRIFMLREDSRWYWYWSGNLTVIGVNAIPALRAVFDTRVCQWLGKLSFSLYLVHALVISITSRPLQALAKSLTAHAGVVCLVEFAVAFPIILVLSTLIERYFDRPSVRFAKLIEQAITQVPERGRARASDPVLALEEAEIPLVNAVIERLSGDRRREVADALDDDNDVAGRQHLQRPVD